MGAANACPAALVRREPGDVAPIEGDPSRVRSKTACDQVEHRGLARAVRPEDAERLALRDFKRKKNRHCCPVKR
jgi:hypothetical protein